VDVNALDEASRRAVLTQVERHRREVLAQFKKTTWIPRGNHLAVPSSEGGYVPAGHVGPVQPENTEPRTF
jgi:hypothetical protein